MDREDEFLNTFFTQVTQLCFDKAKEAVEKERESCKLTQMGPWGMLLMHLPQIAVAERSYSDLGFLHTKNKGFLRKDNSLKTMYESLKSDLKRVEEMTHGTNAVGATVAEISNQLCQFIMARIRLIDFYEKMYNMSINCKVMRHQELLLSIESIIECHILSCSHLALNTIKAALILQSFQKKHDISALVFVFDSRGIQDAGPGYRHPRRDVENTEDFSMVLSVPQTFSQKPFIHWDNIKRNIKDRYADLIIMDKIIFSRDQNNMWTYAMLNIDPRMTFIVAYESCTKQKDKDLHVTVFITDICLQMRCNKIFESLKLSK